MKKSTETPARPNATVKTQKPPFRPAVDDTKPVLQDPVRISLSLSLYFPYIVCVSMSLTMSFELKITNFVFHVI